MDSVQPTARRRGHEPEVAGLSERSESKAEKRFVSPDRTLRIHPAFVLPDFGASSTFIIPKKP